MTEKPPSVHDDIAFMKALVEGGGPSGTAQRSLGQTYAAGGACYGLQCVVGWAQLMGWIVLSPSVTTVVNIAPTVVFIALLVVVSVGQRGAGKQGGIAARAVAAAFASAGTTNLAMIALFAMRAVHEHSASIWFLYPPVVFALQGAAWLVGFMLRRQAWLGLVALGWFVAAVALGAVIDTPNYPLVAGLALIFLMLLPGIVLLRQARKAD